MDGSRGASADVTIVMTARERHSLTEATIEAIVAETTMPYRLVYVDAQSPAWLREVLAARAEEWKLDVISFDEPFWPQEARARIMPRVDTRYVVFIDNDVQVEPGWLEALVACAEETQAGIVGPLYLWEKGFEASKIHMAGGKIVETTEGGGRVLDESHWLFNADPRRVSDQLVRRPCDFVEFHCMLVRAELARDPAFFDPAIRCVHEHIDIALKAKGRGASIWFEPAARVHYMAYADYMLDDLSFFRQRWSRAEGEASIAAFSRRWNVIDDERSFGGVRSFMTTHLEDTDPLRSDAPNPRARGTAMRADELVQTRSGLIDLALARGYAVNEIETVAWAYDLAQQLVDGVYRPCGRPFINHLSGTAGVLLRYDFAARVAAAGLLHAAYTHGHGHAPGGSAEAVNTAIAGALGGEGSALELLVRTYAERESLIDYDSDDPEALAAMSIFDAEILAIEAANEIDMLLAAEIRYSGRSDLVGPATLGRIAHALRAIGVDGMLETLERARASVSIAPEALRSGHVASYRLAQRER